MQRCFWVYITVEESCVFRIDRRSYGQYDFSKEIC